MDLIAAFARRHARRIVQNGRAVLTTNGDPLLVAAFAHLGWTDPHDDAAPAPTPTHQLETTVEPEAPERAVLPRPKKAHHR